MEKESLYSMKLKRNEVDQFGAVELEADRKPIKLIGLCLLISVFVAILYFNSLGNLFTNWDDGMIYQNPSIRDLSWEGIKKIFTLEKGNTYQPIRILSYAIDYRIWKLNPLGYHITNILFYILTCIMVYFTLFHLSKDLRGKASLDSHGRVAIFGSLLFAAHPVHVEAVTWLAARKEVLQGFFFFLAIWLYLKGRGRDGRDKIVYFGLVLLVILLAILSKPSAIIFPAVILVYEIAQGKNKWKSFVRNHWPFFTLSIFISIIFTYVLIKVMLDAGGVKPYRGGSFFNNLLVSFHVFLYNIKLLIFTINYSPAYTISVSNPILSLRTFIFVTITLLLIALSLWSLKHTKIIFFSFLFFLVTLLPYLNIIPISTLLADRYVFIGSFSSCFLLGIGFDRFYASTGKRFSKGFFKLLAITLFLFLLTGYSFMTIWQNRIWENSYTLWADAVEKYPDSNTANALMGVVYMDLAMDQDAIKHLEKAVRLVPYDYLSRNNLGIIYGRQGEPEKALKEFSTAMQLKPDDDTIKINLSVFYQRQKEYKKAEEVLQYLLLKSPENANLHFRLGLIYRDAGRYEEAVSEFLKSVELAPHIINGYEELGNIYASRFRDLKKAKYYYAKGIEAAPKARLRVEDLRWMIQDLEAYK
jgi:tetratricopeptide (TPR) repeat protein